jgi:hypothetical protein
MVFISETKRKFTATLLLLGFLLIPVSGAASHYCFDGKEAPVSVHFDYFDGHEVHDEAEQHVDLEKQLLAEHLVSKFSDLDFVFPLLVPLFAADIGRLESFQYAILSIAGHPSPWLLKPPLRAPPELS